MAGSACAMGRARAVLVRPGSGRVLAQASAATAAVWAVLAWADLEPA
ncbi:MAG: hypothetical protein ACT4PY_06800 [Armatimonadota bacterium]